MGAVRMKVQSADKNITINLWQVIRNTEFNMDENKAVMDKLIVFSIKLLQYIMVIFTTYNFKNRTLKWTQSTSIPPQPCFIPVKNKYGTTLTKV